jgi:putative RNA 2'-phosphotransferase
LKTCQFFEMNEKQQLRSSKFLSLVLRHEPSRIGLTLDSAGWVEIQVLLEALSAHGQPLDRAALLASVAECPKQRFAVSEDGQMIRANQGHSVAIELGYSAQPPPERLYHGTATRFLDSIRASGLRKGERHHVHLSSEIGTAEKVGRRHGQPVVLGVRSGAMQADGHEFFISDNGVWLVDHVAAKFIEFSK